MRWAQIKDSKGSRAVCFFEETVYELPAKLDRVRASGEAQPATEFLQPVPPEFWRSEERRGDPEGERRDCYGSRRGTVELPTVYSPAG